MSTELSVREVELPEQQRYAGHLFPLVLACNPRPATSDAVADWIQRHREELLRQASRHGAILFRGFGIATAKDFDEFIAAFGLENFPYAESLSNAVRVNRTQRVFTANEAPPETKIYLHHEMAQTPIFPSRLFFFCEHAAATGGATPVCRSDVLWERIARECPRFAQDCRAKGLRYSNVMPGENDLASGMGRSWKLTLRASTRDEAERRLETLGYTWEWLADGSLRATTPTLPAVRDLGDGRISFFNQLIAAFQGWKDSRNDPAEAIRFGDGTMLDRASVDRATEIAQSMSFDIPWQAGDVALVDNFVAMHGRKPFTGTRKVLASLVDVQRHGEPSRR